jgi:hypothetical protein
MLLRAFFFTLILIAAFVLSHEGAHAQIREPEYYQGARYDSVYWDPAYRDSVANYTYRLHAYRFEILNYDLGFTLSMLPVLGQWYVGNTTKGIVYSGARAGALAVSTIGVAGLFTKGNDWRDAGMAVGGLVLYGVLKYLDIMDVQRAISRNNEYIVEKFSIATEDIEPTSIRYPEKEWPAWVTEPPPAREPQPHREIFDKPIPSLPETRGTSDHYRIGLSIPF